MKCPFCGVLETKVIDSRLNQSGDATRRRRECESCQGRFTTHERIEVLMPMIIKKDGRREPYSQDKILSGLHKACQKRPITMEQIEQLVRNIEQKITALNAKEIPSNTIGEMVMAALHKLDQIAYVRFASVYREFHDVKDFITEIQDKPYQTQDTKDAPL